MLLLPTIGGRTQLEITTVAYPVSEGSYFKYFGPPSELYETAEITQSTAEITRFSRVQVQ